MQRKANSLLFYLLLLAAGLTGFGLVLYSTVWGAGWMTDSFQYVSAAVNLVQGKGLVYTLGADGAIPMTHYPPMYSVWLSLAELLKIDIISFARLLNALLMGGNVFLLGLSLITITRSSAFALVGAAVAAATSSLIEVHSWVLSEPLFLFLCLLSLYILGFYLNEPQPGANKRTTILLITSAFCAGFAFLTRYAGITLLVAGILAQLLASHKPWLQKIKAALAWTTISLLPILLWTWRNNSLSGGFNDRSFGVNLMTPKNIGVFLNTILTWWFPPTLINGNEKIILAVLAAAILLLLVWLVARRTAFKDMAVRSFHSLRFSAHPLLLLHAVFTLTYALMILALKNILEEGMGLGDRMLIPLYPSALILLMALLNALWSKKVNWSRGIAIVVCAYLLSNNGFATLADVRDFHETGFGVSKRAWHDSPAVQLLAQNTAKPVYSNSPQSVYLWTRQAGYPLSSLKSRTKRGVVEPSLVILFNYIAEDDLLAKLDLDLQLLERDNIAAIYLYNP